MDTCLQRFFKFLFVVITVAASGASTFAQNSSPQALSSLESGGAKGQLDGTWEGTAKDNTGPGQLSFVLKEDGTGISGSSYAYDPTTGTVKGSVKGTFDGSDQVVTFLLYDDGWRVVMSR